MRNKALSSLPAPAKKLLRKTFGGTASNVFKGMATLALGSGVARLISIAAIPILTRLYSPEDFGVLSVFTALIAILSPLLTLRYVLALPLPRHDGMAFNLLMLSSGLMLCMTLLISLLLWIAGEHLLAILSMEVLAPWWWLISLGLLASACYETLTLWATRRRNYRVIAKTNVWQSMTGSFAKIGLGLLTLKPEGLLIGQVLAMGGGIGNLLRGFRSEFRSNLRFLRLSRIRKAAWQYRGFPTYRVPSQFFLISSQQAPLLFVASFYGIAVAGQLAIAKLLVSMPVKLISGSLTQAAYGELAKIGKNNPTKIRSVFREVSRKLLVVSSITCITVFFLSPMVLPAILGDQWEQAGNFASYLSVYLVATIIAVPLPAFINVYGMQGEFLIWNIIRSIIIGCMLLVVYFMEYRPEVFVMLYGVSMFLFQTGVIVRVSAILRHKSRK